MSEIPGRDATYGNLGPRSRFFAAAHDEERVRVARIERMIARDGGRDHAGQGRRALENRRGKRVLLLEVRPEPEVDGIAGARQFVLRLQDALGMEAGIHALRFQKLRIEESGALPASPQARARRRQAIRASAQIPTLPRLARPRP